MSALQAVTGTNAYQQVNRYTGIEGANPHQLVALLMQGAIDNLAAAKGYMDRSDFDRKAKTLSKVIAIVTELKSSLDMDNGGEISENLSNLYDYMFKLILAGSMENNPDRLTEASDLMQSLLDSWNTIPDSFRDGV